MNNTQTFIIFDTSNGDTNEIQARDLSDAMQQILDNLAIHVFTPSEFNEFNSDK